MSVWNVQLRKALHHGASRFALDVSFGTDAERLVLVGPSGAGKTQTLRMIAGITRPDAGRVCVAGRVLSDDATGAWLAPGDRRLGVVFQDYALFPHLSVRQNIAFGRQTGWRNPSRRSAVPAAERWIEQFRLQAVADHLPHQLSGGQRQRTALARALVNDPAALLLDEPFAALDKSLRLQLRDELLELQTALRIPLLLITHDDDDVQCLGQAVVALESGRVVVPPPPPQPPSGRPTPTAAH